MAATIDELDVDYEEGGQLLSKTLDKKVLSKGAWSTIIFKYQDWDRKKEDFGAPKFTIRRYQKRNGEYMHRSKFNISSIDQAKGIVEALQGWIDEADKD